MTARLATFLTTRRGLALYVAAPLLEGAAAAALAVTFHR